MKNKIKDINSKDIASWGKNNIFIILLTLFFAVIYGIRMFTNYPWYDELYTYYSFICRGPIYAAIHWPVPNNHVGYSALSGFLSYFGNATIALRGVAYVSSVANVVLVYVLTERLTVKVVEDSKIRKALGILATLVFASVLLVHTLAIQGRGYALSTTCLIVATIMVDKIAFAENITKKNENTYYVLYSMALALGIYVLPSSTFWVIPLCITGGLILLRNKKLKELFKLIVFSAIAAVVVVFLYLIIWMAIGSNLLSKTEGSGYTGVYQLTILKQVPFKAIKTGFDYMMASPYIQSVDRGVVVRELVTYLKNLFNQFYPNAGYVMLVFLGIAFVFSLVTVLSDRKRLLELFVMVNILSMPVLLIIQSKQPYLRVFSFFGVVVAEAVIMFMVRFKIKRILIYVISLLFMALLFTGSYNIPIADRENDIHDVLIRMEEEGTPVTEINNILYIDDYQKYVIKFYYDYEPTEASSIENADFILMPTEEINGVWPYLFSENDFDIKNIQKNYKEVTKTVRYVIYRRQ